MTTSKINFSKQSLKQNWLNNLALLIAGFQDDYNSGVLVVTFRGCDDLTTNVICELLQEKRNVLNERYNLLPAFYTMELKRISYNF